MDIITNYKNHLRHLAASTQKTYLSEFKDFVIYFRGEDYRYIPKDKIVAYLATLYDRGYSSSKVNQTINAIKFYKEKVLGQKRQTYFLKRSRREKFFPPILSQEKMRELIMSPQFIKHRALLFTIYDNGLRKSEALNLKLSNVRTKFLEHPHICIVGAKNHGDRIINLSDDCIELLKEYYRICKPSTYLFEGAKKGEPYSASSLANVLKTALNAVEITERFRVHDLRHNFATHCLMNGTDIYHLSRVLGHKSVTTTEKYYAHLPPEQVVIKRPVFNENTKIRRIKIAS